MGRQVTNLQVHDVDSEEEVRRRAKIGEEEGRRMKRLARKRGGV